MQQQLVTLAVALGTVTGALSLPAAAQTGTSSHPAPSAVTVSTAAAPVVQPPAPKHHSVAAGESLSIIAQTEGLDSWRSLWNANNNVTDPNLIYPGEDLVVPDGPTADRPLPAGFDAASMPVYAPAPAAVAQRQAAARPATSANYAAGVGGILAAVRQRESGGNYATNTGNGYYGAYQFSLGTWQGVGGTGLPSDASPAEQDMRAQMLYSERGCSPWPNTCY